MIDKWTDRARKGVADALELHDSALRSKQSLERARAMRKQWAITYQTLAQIKSFELRANDAMCFINEACDAISVVEVFKHIEAA